MKTWKPIIAGILSIIGGVIITILGVSHLIVGPGLVVAETHRGELAQGIISLVLGLTAITGGIYAIKQRLWGLALAGAICAIYTPHFYGKLIWTPILGILAIVFVALSKKEFSNSTRKPPSNQ
jgi:hypothetical protein